MLPCIRKQSSNKEKARKRYPRPKHASDDLNSRKASRVIHDRTTEALAAAAHGLWRRPNSN